MSLLKSIFIWIRKHLLISLGVLLVLGLLVWGAKPAFTAATYVSMQNCGSLTDQQPQTQQSNTGAVQALKCFAEAHQQCHAASLSYTTRGVDTGSKDTYYTANGLGGCELSGESTVSGVFGDKTTGFRCSSVTQQTDGLHLNSCGEYGDLLVPASATKA